MQQNFINPRSFLDVDFNALMLILKTYYINQNIYYTFALKFMRHEGKRK